MVKRLFLCNGPMQILNILTLIEEQGNLEHYEDYLCIYGTLVNHKNHSIYKVMNHLYKIHKWVHVCHIYSNQNLQYNTQELYDILSNDKFDEIFAVRNRGNISSYVINTFKSAKIIIYGDNLGVFDSIISEDETIYPTIDEVRVITPIFCTNKFDELKQKIKIKQVDKKYLEIIVKKVVENLELTDLYTEGQYSIYLTSYFSQLQWCTKEEEVEMYYNHIQSTVGRNTYLLIKPHPRDYIGIAQQLQEKLTQQGFNVQLIDDSKLMSLPLEIFPIFMNVVEVLTLASATFINLNLLYPQLKCSLMKEQDIEKYIKNNRIKIFIHDLYSIINNYMELEEGNQKFSVYAKNSYQEKCDLRKNSIDKSIESFVERFKKNRAQVFFYGAGSYLYEIRAAEILNSFSIEVNGVFDRSVEKQGTYFAGLETYHTTYLESMIEKGEKVYILITSSFQDEIILYLESIGLKRNIDYFTLFYDFYDCSK